MALDILLHPQAPALLPLDSRTRLVPHDEDLSHDWHRGPVRPSVAA